MAGMRLRLRRAAPPPAARPSLPEGWHRPRWSGRGTGIGTLDGGARALVDPAGLVSPAGRTWSLDWWVGAEDRWRLPADEVAVRQRLVGSAPVVETRLRVPSGDAVHRAYAARTLAGHDVLVVEVENASKVPFAVALALRPVTTDATGSVERLQLHGDRLEVDGETALLLPRAPGRAALGAGAGGDVTDLVLDGRAGEVAGLAPVACTDGLANGALLFPLAHTATLRVVLPLGGPDVAPGEVPGPDDVASGWARQVSVGARVELPDRRLRDAVAASARHLLLASPSAEVAEALDLLGLRDAATVALDAAVRADARRPGALLRALGRHGDLTPLAPPATPAHDLVARTADVDLPLVVAEAVAGLARTDAADRAVGHAALPSVARLLTRLGEDRAAADVEALAQRAADDADERDVEAALSALLRDASGTWTWAGPAGPHDPAVNAAAVSLVRDLLVAEGDRTLALSPVVPEPWLGQGWEVHDLPTRHGALSFAVRWHGERPALLWELVPTGTEPVALTAPGLDPGFRTADPTGEALLAPVALPEREPRRGLTMPVAIEPLHRRSS